jgi:hypothetical protein
MAANHKRGKAAREESGGSVQASGFRGQRSEFRGQGSGKANSGIFLTPDP